MVCEILFSEFRYNELPEKQWEGKWSFIYMGFTSWHFVIAFVWCTWLLRFKGAVSNIRQRDAQIHHCEEYSCSWPWTEAPSPVPDRRSSKGTKAEDPVASHRVLPAERPDTSETRLFSTRSPAWSGPWDICNSPETEDRTQDHARVGGGMKGRLPSVTGVASLESLFRLGRC